jgi:TonB family protein
LKRGKKMKTIFMVTILIGIMFGIQPDLFGQAKTKSASKTVKPCQRPSLYQPQQKIVAPAKVNVGDKFSIFDGDNKSGAGMGSGRGQGVGTGTGDGVGQGVGNGTGSGSTTEKKTTAETETPLTLRNVPPTADIYIFSKPRPSYTEAARAEQVNGEVILRVTFLASGKIGKISVVKGLPNGLTEQAKAAAEKIRFEPARRNCKELTVTKQVTYSFMLY